MDPYTEYLGTGLARQQPSYRVPQPAPQRSRRPRATRRQLTSRAHQWLRRRP